MGNPSKIVPSISPYFNQMLNMPVQTKAIVLVTKLTKFNGNMSYTVQEAKAFLKNVIGLSGKPIENFEAKIEAAISDPMVKNMISSFGGISDTLRYYAENPTVEMMRKNPKLFLFASKTSKVEGNAINIVDKFSKCRSIQDLQKLVVDTESIKDCKYIINKLTGTNATEVLEAAKIKVAYLVKQKQETDIASKIGNASKAYVAPQIFVK